eukprot:9325711-Pyramimonas_sp.AAC.1
MFDMILGRCAAPKISDVPTGYSGQAARWGSAKRAYNIVQREATTHRVPSGVPPGIGVQEGP